MSRPVPLLVATRNQGKLRELRRLLNDLPLDVHDLSMFQNVSAIPETGKTFQENATLKATGYAKQTGVLTLAEDSGLEVDEMDGAPGLFSARFAGLDASNEARINKILRELSRFPDSDRRARFVSAIAVADKNGEMIHLSQGVCEGRIARSSRGTQGFGYDPIFIPDGYNMTFGELLPETKNRISHRANALAGAYAFLRSLTEDRRAG